MLNLQTKPGSPAYFTAPLLERAGIPHAFSTRLGGVSRAPFDELNLGNPSGTGPKDDPASIQENYARLEANAGIRGTRCYVHQVHSAELVRVEAGVPHENSRQADALWSDDPARSLSVRVADCVPVLLATENGACVAVVHAGWRGVAAGIVPLTAKKLMSAAPGAALVAAIGPAICGKCFEIDGEVLLTFKTKFPQHTVLGHGSSRKGWVDLRACIGGQLAKCGVPDSRIDTTNLCSRCESELFFSHRRNGPRSGRMAALIQARAK